MKLAEALSIRAELQKKTEQLEQRLKSVVKIQEGDIPEESPAGSGSDANQDAFPASMRKHFTIANFRHVMPINNALPNADCNDTRAGKGEFICIVIQK